MTWDELRNGVYEIDGSWRDIYVLDATKADWQKWIEHVNANYHLTWTAEDYDNGAVLNKIDKHFINWRWDEEHYTTCASVFLEDIQINCFFFTDEQIENDIDPSQVKSLADHEKIIDYMKSISKLLGKTVILTGENCPEYAIVKVNRDVIEFT